MTRPRGPASRPTVTMLGAGSSGGSTSPLSAFLGDSGSKPMLDTLEPSPAILGLSERQFQALVVSSLRCRGFVVVIVPDMRKTQAGWPDLVFWHPARPGRLFCWELKTMRGRPTTKQHAALAHLQTVSGVDARLVRPSLWPALRDWIDTGMPEAER
jgi:hypothetical protein